MSLLEHTQLPSAFSQGPENNVKSWAGKRRKKREKHCPGNSGGYNQLISTLSVVRTTVNKENGVINNGNTFAGESRVMTGVHHLGLTQEKREALSDD